MNGRLLRADFRALYGPLSRDNATIAFQFLTINTINTKKHSLKGYFPTSVKGLKSRRTEEGEKDVLKGGEEKKLGEEQRTGMRSHSLIG
jgi:hypothetical protein